MHLVTKTSGTVPGMCHSTCPKKSKNLNFSPSTPKVSKRLENLTKCVKIFVYSILLQYAAEMINPKMPTMTANQECECDDKFEFPTDLISAHSIIISHRSFIQEEESASHLSPACSWAGVLQVSEASKQGTVFLIKNPDAGSKCVFCHGAQ